MRRRPWVLVAWLALATTGAGADQLGGALRRAQQMREVQLTDEEEQQLGAGVSERIRTRYGVVQDAAVHRYVSLVGTVLAQASPRANLAYRFIVLDTDGVNAFAAPGGYIHITRGALGLMQSEGELAGVLAHEVVHVTEKHTIRAIQKGKLVQMGAEETVGGNKVLLSQLVEKATDIVMAGFGRAEELESDDKGLVLANKVGYAPQALSAFLTTLAERNKSASERQGLFASHPEMKERQQRIAKQIASQKLLAAITLPDRYRKTIVYKPVPPSQVAPAPSAAATGGSTPSPKPPEAERQQGFGLSNLVRPSGSEKNAAEVTGSGAARGVDTERNARGGAVATPVNIALTAADIAAFKKEGKLN